MKNYKGIKRGFLISSILLNASIHSQAVGPYSNSSAGGQTVFVHSPYNSAVYTEYKYDLNQQGRYSNRLPSYTTNQSVFIQQPYATPQQVVTNYPSYGSYHLNYKQSGYNTPSDYPSTVTVPYPFATVRSYTSSPYTTTVQYPSYNPMSPGIYTTETYAYPYTTVRQPTPAMANQLGQPSYITNTDTAYPIYSTDPNSVYSKYQGSPNVGYPIYSTDPTNQMYYSNYPTTPNMGYANNPYSTTTFQSTAPYPLTTALPETNAQLVTTPRPPPPVSPYYTSPRR
jgi:hypothetical protein